MKETFYFSHDYNARNDIKIKKLISKHGLLGYGIYWALIEELYNNHNSLPMDFETLAYDLHVESDTIHDIVTSFKLFLFDEDTFGSSSVQTRLEQRETKSFKAKQSAMKRWVKDANALPTNNEGNAIKERKVKENKVKESKSNKIDFNESKSLNDVSTPKTKDSSGKQVKTAKKTEQLTYPYHSSAFLDAWSVLIKEKKWIKKSSAALQASLNKLAGFGESGAIESINDAISGAYQGVFAPKSFQQQNQVSKPQQKINAFEEAKKILNNDISNNNAD